MLLNAATYHGVWMHQLLWERAGISTGSETLPFACVSTVFLR